MQTIALSVPDVEQAYREAVARGARGLREPWAESDEHGTVFFAEIAAYGDTVHRFVDRSQYRGAFRPGYEQRS
ncbi:VOC family protein, partial [Escherichia coli]|nr:VOC family protein [Escherichia coli]